MNFAISAEPRCRRCGHVRYTHIEDKACNAGHVLSAPGNGTADQGACSCSGYVPQEVIADEDR